MIDKLVPLTGVWKFMTKQEAVELVRRHSTADDASWELVSEARRRAQVNHDGLEYNFLLRACKKGGKAGRNSVDRTQQTPQS